MRSNIKAALAGLAALTVTLLLLRNCRAFLPAVAEPAQIPATNQRVAIPDPADRSEDPALTNSLGNAVGQVAQLAKMLVAGEAQSSSVQCDSSSDAEWNAFPRTPDKLVTLLRSAPLQPKRFFRNAHLNPRDVYIPRSNRELLVAYLLEVNKSVGDLARTRSQVATLDLEFLVEHGMALVEGADEFRSRLAPEEAKALAEAEDAALQSLSSSTGRSLADLKADPTTRVCIPELVFRGRPVPEAWSFRGGKLYSGTLEQLPNALAAARAQAFAYSDIAANVTSFFFGRGCLTSAEVDPLFDAVIASEPKSALAK